MTTTFHSAYLYCAILACLAQATNAAADALKGIQARRAWYVILWYALATYGSACAAFAVWGIVP